MKMSNVKRIMVLLVLVLLIGQAVGAQSNPVNVNDITKDNYFKWRLWSNSTRVFYLYGLISGFQAMAAHIAYNSGYVDLLRMAEASIPTYQIRDYVAFISWVYQKEKYWKVPIYVLVLKAEEYTELRKED